MNRSRLICIAATLFVGVCLIAPSASLGQEIAPTDAGNAIDGVYGYGLPPMVSKDGQRVDNLIIIIHWFMIALFSGWAIFFVYCLMRFRAKAGHKASYKPIKAKVSKYAEIGVAAFEAFLLIGLSMPIWAATKIGIPSKDEATHVRVLAEQFQWNFHYPGADGKFGRTAPEKVDTVENPLGLDRSDPAAADDVYATELHLPVNRPVICELTSKDVIHSFSLPVMRVKQDVFPGMRIPVWFTPIKAGRYEVACAQLCGNNHYSMRAEMVIEDDASFATWLEEVSKVEEFDEDELD